MKKIFITTAIDYTNDVIHIGHAYQKILADAFARYFRLAGDKTYFLVGTDEYGTTSEKAAIKAGKDPKEYVDEISSEDKAQYKSLNISYDRFIRTTDADHHKTVEEFYKRVYDAGDIYKGAYEGLYCEGCEAYKTLSELEDGKCPLHKTREITKVSEENYFFKWSKYQNFLLKHIKDNPQFIVPKNRIPEMVSFLKHGLEDIPISRPKYKVSWGIPLPTDAAQTIYVWFDALINYYTASLKGTFWDKDTRIIHILGKDNLRMHALLWPAMLHSAGLRLPDTILTHGFINLNGQKVSKSLGNIIRPKELVNEYGSDATRYFLLRFGPFNEDVDITLEKIKKAYNADLANDWGNLVSRVAKLCETSSFVPEKLDSATRPAPVLAKAPSGEPRLVPPNFSFTPQVDEAYRNLSIFNVLEHINYRITDVNQYINREKPWELKGEALHKVLSLAVDNIKQIAYDFLPIMPETSQKILDQFSAKKVTASSPYFLRKK